jgi:hypothetical protein
MTNEGRAELGDQYNVPGQRRAYTSCPSSSSDEKSSQSPGPGEVETVLGPGSDGEDGVSMVDVEGTIRRAPPSRPPRGIDSAQNNPATQPGAEYYNLCHPPPLDPAPTIPRRKPYISNPDLGTERPSTAASCWTEATGQIR